MSVLFLDFEGSERNTRVQKLARTGAHIVASEPRWPAFFELAKREKPYAIAIDFAQAPSHSLETADYLAKAKETRDAAIYLLRVPEDRVDIVAKRLPQATRVTDQELAVRVAEAEKQAQERARQKKEAAAAARKTARARVSGEKAAGPARPPAPAKESKAAAKPATKPAARAKQPAAKPAKKPASPKKKAAPSRASRPARKR
jgi:predicted Zn-dependent protease